MAGVMLDHEGGVQAVGKRHHPPHGGQAVGPVDVETGHPVAGDLFLEMDHVARQENRPGFGQVDQKRG